MAQLLTLKCGKGHTLAKATCNRADREIICDLCEEELPNGDDFFQCRKCEYDACAGCFKRHATKGTSSSKFGLVHDKLTHKDDKKDDKDKKTVHVETEHAMDAEDTRAFAFTGFPPGTDETHAIEVLREHIFDYLSDFAVTIVGANTPTGQIAVSYPKSQGGALMAKLHEHRDHFAYRQTVLTTVDVDMIVIDSFRMPVPSSSSKGASAASSGPQPWPAPPHLPQFNGQQAFIGTPARTAPASTVPSVSPELCARRQRLEAVRAQLAPPESDEPTNKDLLTAIKNMSGRMALKEDIEVAQLETVKIFRQEIEPVKAHVAAIDTSVTQALDETKNLNERLTVVEAGQNRLNGLENEIKELRARLEASPSVSFKKEKHDPAFLQVAFAGFTEKTKDSEKVTALRGFMAKHFTGIQVMHVDHFNATASFVQLGTQKIQQNVCDEIRSKKLSLDSFSNVKIRPALTACDRSRNWALNTAKELIEKDPRSGGKSVEMKRAQERGIYVGGRAAFRQEARYDPRGVFVQDYADLKLP